VPSLTRKQRRRKQAAAEQVKLDRPASTGTPIYAGVLAEQQIEPPAGE